MIKFKHTVEEWKGRIWEALEYRAKYGREDKWAQLEAMHQNLANSGSDTGPNIIQEMGAAIIARMQLDQMKITVTPSILDPSSVETYPAVQAIDNWLMEEMDTADVMNMASLHAYLWSRGIIKIGYDSEFGYSPELDVNPDDPMGFTLSQFSKNGKHIEYNSITPGMPWMSAVLPHDFGVPWGTVKLENAPWCFHRFYRHIDELKADPKYSKLGKVVPNLSMDDIIMGYTKTGSDAARQRAKRSNTLGAHMLGSKVTNAEFVELYEIHNRADGRIIVISDFDVHRNEIDAMQVDGLPFKSISFIDHPRTFWTTPQAQYLEFHQAEENDIVKQASIQRRMNSFKLLMKDGSMEDSELEKILMPETGIIAMTKPHFDPRVDMTPVPQSNNFQLYQDMQFTKGNAREAIGFSRNQLGDFDSSSRRTATESQIVQQGSQFRSEPRMSAIRKLYKDTFRFVNLTIFKFWKTPRFVKLPDGSWPQLNGEDLKAEYSYKISAGPSASEDHDIRKQQALSLYVQLAQDPRVNQAELIEYVKRVIADPELDRIFVQPQQTGDPNATLQLPVSTLPEGV